MDQTRPRPDINDPERWFRQPQDIVESRDLTRGQKLLALDRWQGILQARLRRSRTPAARDIALLEAVGDARKAIAALDRNSGLGPSLRSWVRRPR